MVRDEHQGGGPAPACQPFQELQEVLARRGIETRARFI
jgi:hypothetical protein